MLRKLVGKVEEAQTKAKSRGVATVVYTGKSVAHWLNDPSTPARQRIIELLNQIALVLELEDSDEAKQALALARINELLRPYIWQQRFVDKHSGRLFGFAVSASPSPVEDVELWSAKCVSDLAEQGLGTGIRRCRHCLRWFFTTRPKKKFWCTTACRKSWIKNDPEKKEKRKKYAGDYYRDYLSPVTGKWAKLARKERTRRKAS